MAGKSVLQPKSLIDHLEEEKRSGNRSVEHFSGFGVMGLTFSSGHILGLRRFPSSSVGPVYTSVWFRNPQGRWSFFQNVQPDMACPRYFGKAISKSLVRNINITWTSAQCFTVTIGEDVDLSWKVRLTSTSSTRIMNTISKLIPGFFWHNKIFLKVMSGFAGRFLKAGHIGMFGKTPNGQWFKANPKKIWIVESSSASLRGNDFGNIEPLQHQAKLGDFWIPQVGIFAIGDADFELFKPTKHQLITSLQRV